MCDCRCCRGVCGCEEVLRLVSYQILFTRRGLEVVFPSRQQLLNECLCPSQFTAWKVAEFVQRLPETRVPRKWARLGYPPASCDGFIVAIPPPDQKYLRVECQVLDCWPRQPFKYEERNVEALQQINRSIQTLQPPEGVRLPAAGRLSGRLDPARSRYGDTFVNFPEFLGDSPPPGDSHLEGWLEVAFDEPEESYAEFSLSFNGVGSTETVTFGKGQQYQLLDNRVFSNPGLPGGAPPRSGGRLNLATGEVEDVQVHAVFLNSVIAEINRLNRIPFSFPFDAPSPLPPGRPGQLDDLPQFAEIRFSYRWNGSIEGLELRSKAVSPVPLLPFSGRFAGFSFGPDNAFHFANPTRCLDETKDCPGRADNPDGIRLPLDAVLNPHLELACGGFEESSEGRIPPCSPTAVSAALLVNVDGRLYQMGGFDPQGLPTDSLHIYDPASGRWEGGPSLPQAVAAAQGAAVGRKIVVAGGFSRGRRPISDQVQIFDTRSGRWQSEADPIPVAVAQGASAAVGDKLYVIGGLRQGDADKLKVTDDLQIFDAAAGTWSRGRASILNTAGSAAVAVGRRIYQINGRLPVGNVVDWVAVYDTELDDWEEGPPTRRGVLEAAAGLVGGRIYLAGGRASLDGPSLNSLQVLDVREGVWREGFPQPVPTAASGGTVLQDALYLAGGIVMGRAADSPGEVTDLVQAFHPSAGWVLCDGRPVFTAAEVLNAASLSVGPSELSPGSRAVLTGQGFAAQASTGTPGTSLQGISILVDRKKALILAVSADRVYFQIPEKIKATQGAARRVKLEVRKKGSQAASATIDIVPAAPGIFVYSFGETRSAPFLEYNSALACNQDGSLNCASQPAVPGERISLWVTGLGQVPKDPQKAAEKVAVFVGDTRRKASVEAVEPVGGQPGVYRVQACLPEPAQFSSNVPVTVRVGGVGSNRAVVAIRQESARLDPPLPCDAGIRCVLAGQCEPQ